MSDGNYLSQIASCSDHVEELIRLHSRDALASVHVSILRFKERVATGEDAGSDGEITQVIITVIEVDVAKRTRHAETNGTRPCPLGALPFDKARDRRHLFAF